MRIRRMLLIALLALALGASALGEGYHIEAGNGRGFGRLLYVLLRAYQHPSDADARDTETVLGEIGAVSARDRQLAQAIADHWNAVYINADGAFRLHTYHGGTRAVELEGTAIENSASHAFVVLGYELKNGAMRDELKGRCAAAAAAANSFPNALIMCSGGATGRNNPAGNTEAGLMKNYLVKQCGIDKSRIHIDEQAMSTVQNAINTFEMLRQHDVRTITIVTSAYHQRWGQALYNCMAEMYRLAYGYSVEIVENYCFEIEVPSNFKNDAWWAIRQLAAMLDLPESIRDAIEKAR